MYNYKKLFVQLRDELYGIIKIIAGYELAILYYRLLNHAHLDVLLLILNISYPFLLNLQSISFIGPYLQNTSLFSHHWYDFRVYRVRALFTASCVFC